jgi:2'-phosphotransferase
MSDEPDVGGSPATGAARKGRGGRRIRATDPVEARREAVSKTLSWMLRHHAEDCGLSIRSDGFCPVQQVLATKEMRKLKATFAELQEVVARCPKQRFSLVQENLSSGAFASSSSAAAIDSSDSSQDLTGWMIRANQGHSAKTAALLADDALLERITEENASTVTCCVHGTYFSAWPLICRTGGLKRMSRAHVHFASGELGSDHVRSGLRSSAQILCYLDVTKALAEGLPLFRSANGVLLSPGFGDEGIVPLRLFSRFVEAKTGKAVEVVTTDDAKKPAEGEGSGAGASSVVTAAAGAGSASAADDKA